MAEEHSSEPGAPEAGSSLRKPFPGEMIPCALIAVAMGLTFGWGHPAIAQEFTRREWIFAAIGDAIFTLLVTSFVKTIVRRNVKHDPAHAISRYLILSILGWVVGTAVGMLANNLMTYATTGAFAA